MSPFRFFLFFVFVLALQASTAHRAQRNCYKRLLSIAHNSCGEPCYEESQWELERICKNRDSVSEDQIMDICCPED